MWSQDYLFTDYSDDLWTIVSKAYTKSLKAAFLKLPDINLFVQKSISSNLRWNLLLTITYSHNILYKKREEQIICWTFFRVILNFGINIWILTTQYRFRRTSDMHVYHLEKRNLMWTVVISLQEEIIQLELICKALSSIFMMWNF